MAALHVRVEVERDAPRTRRSPGLPRRRCAGNRRGSRRSPWPARASSARRLRPVDFRMNAAGELFVLEVNPNPTSHRRRDGARPARGAPLCGPHSRNPAAGLALGRGDADPAHRTGDRERSGAGRGTAAFKPFEVDVAMELVDAALTQKEQDDYHPYVLVEDDARWSPTPASGRTR